MKKYISLFALWTRQCVYKFFLLLLVMGRTYVAMAGGFALSQSLYSLRNSADGDES